MWVAAQCSVTIHLELCIETRYRFMFIIGYYGFDYMFSAYRMINDKWDL